ASGISRSMSIVSFFFLMILLPPTSTLFPYTTLFRSQDLENIPITGTDPTAPPSLLASLVSTERGAGMAVVSHYNVAPDLRQVSRSEGTRLNSSHLVISYAVFCLKKKKSKQLSIPTIT